MAPASNKANRLSDNDLQRQKLQKPTTAPFSFGRGAFGAALFGAASVLDLPLGWAEMIPHFTRGVTSIKRLAVAHDISCGKCGSNRGYSGY
jgi:hypothetical protein